jgi:amino acid transporter
MARSAPARSASGALFGELTTPRIVFLVVAAAAPMAAMVGTVPLAFAIGDGAATPAIFVFAGLVLLCFSVGYAAMSRRVVNTGAFYTYIARGLGKPPAVGGALVAVIAYNAMAVGLVGAFGYFGNIALQQDFSIDVPWQVCAAVGLVAAGAFGYRKVDISARVLAVLMVAEIAILLVLDFAVIGDRGGAALPSTSFAPHTIFSAGGSLGVGMMFAFVSFIGFESAALYGEESRNPERSIPLGTYISVGLIAVFYGFTSWVAVGAVGADKLQAVAGKQLGNLFFALNTQYVSSFLTKVMTLLLVTSLFASLLALHNAASRYMFALGRERILPTFLGVAHGRHQAPSRASLVQTAVNIVVVAAFAIAGSDPYLNLATTMLGLGTIGIVVLQAAASFSVIGFFRARPDRHWFKTLLAPLLGGLGLTAASVLVAANYSTLTGSSSSLVNSLPWMLAVVAVGGVAYALWLRANRREVYAELAGAGAEREAGPLPPEQRRATVAAEVA